MFTKNRFIQITLLLVSMIHYQSSVAMIVLDPSNLAENVKQTLKQIEQHKSQLKEYNLLLKNSKSLDKFTWNEVNNNINSLLNSIDTLKYYKSQTGSIDAYLSRYQNIEHYQTNPCVNTVCTEAQKEILYQHEKNSSEAQKRANDAVLKGIDKQQETMLTDARHLEELQRQAEDAKGQMAAIQAANQLASSEVNQLLQIRGLLLSEQTRAATRAAIIADREAIQAAGDAQFRSGSFKKSSGLTW